MTDQATIVVVGRPDVAEALRAAGCDVAGGSTFSADAPAAKVALDGPEPPAVVSGADFAPGQRPWLTRQAQRTTVVILRGDDDDDPGVVGAETIATPATVDALILATGADPVSGTGGSVVIGGDGLDAVPAPPETPPAVSDDPWGPDPAPAPAPDLAPAEPASSAPAPAPPETPPAVSDDPWAPSPAPDPAPPEPAPPESGGSTPVPADDPWAGAPPPLPEPGPIPATPADDPWAVTAAPERDPEPASEPVGRRPPLELEPQPATAPASPPLAPNPPGTLAVTDDDDNIFSEDDSPGVEPADRHGPARPNSALAPLVFIVAAKGGVGKTTTALTLAERAATQGQLKTALIDMNRGQGDVTTYLKVNGKVTPGRPGRPRLPTVWDAVRTRNISRSFAEPDEINAARNPNRPPLHFWTALGPPPDRSDSATVTSEVYASIIAESRRHFDLVVVDTQIIESFDTSGLIDNVVTPMLASGAWVLGLTDPSSAGVKNLAVLLRRWNAAGISSDRLTVAINRHTGAVALNQASTARTFGTASTLLGVIAADDSVVVTMNAGGVPVDSPSFTAVLDDLLYRVTDDPRFDPARRVEVPAGGLWAKVGARVRTLLRRG